MDNLTHSLVGAAIAKSGAERATPLATATLVIAANAPDIDVLSFVNGSYFALQFRRGITHGFPALAVLALVITAGVLTWDRAVRLKRRPDEIPARPTAVLGLAVVGLLSHPMLDWLNVYGIRWAMPFQEEWSYGDSLFIIDPWIWLLLGGALYLSTDFGTRGRRIATASAFVAGALVFAGMGALGGAIWACGALAFGVTGRNVGHLGERQQRGVAIAATGATALYILTMVTADGRARAQVIDAAEAEGWTVEDVLVSPRRGNPFAAEVEVQTAAGYVPGQHRWLGSPRVVLFPSAAVPRLHVPPALDPQLAARIVAHAHADQDAEYFLRWSRYPWTRVDESADGWSVRIGDARYDDFPESRELAGITVEVSRDEVR